MGYTFEYLEYLVNVRIRKDKSRRSYVGFGDIFSKIEFTKACFSKHAISLSKFDILRIKVEDMEKTC